MKTKIAIIDLDGILIDNTHRVHYIKSDPPDIDSFFDYHEMIKDKINDWAYELAQGLRARDIQPVLITGRPERTRQATTKVLATRGGVFSLLFNSPLYMRKDGDHRKSEIVKQDILDFFISKQDDAGDTVEIVLAIDDKKETCDMWRARGITTLYVDSGNYDLEDKFDEA